MPIFMYKAITKNGVIVKNRVDDISKYALVQKLKKNDLTPIDIIQARTTVKRDKVKRKNMKPNDALIKNIDLIKTNKTTKTNFTVVEKLNFMLSTTEKITPRDIIIFTESFLLLKKSNFNNIHA